MKKDKYEVVLNNGESVFRTLRDALRMERRGYGKVVDKPKPVVKKAVKKKTVKK